MKLVNILKKRNSSLYYFSLSFYYILKKQEDKAAESFAEFLRNNKKSVLKELKRNIILWYGFFLFFKFGYKDEFAVLLKYFDKNSQKTDVDNVIKTILIEKKVSSILNFNRAKSFEGIHIAFYYNIFNDDIYLYSYDYEVEYMQIIFPFFKKEFDYFEKKIEPSFVSLAKLIQNTDLSLDEDYIESLKDQLKNAVQSKNSELVWVYNGEEILPYQKRKTKNNRYSFKKLKVDSLINNGYSWISSEDKIFSDILYSRESDIEYALLIILNLIVDTDKFYFKEDEQNFIRILLKKSLAPLIIDKISDKNCIVFEEYYLFESWFFREFNNNIIIFHKVPSIIKKISKYVKLKSLDSGDYYFQIPKPEDFKEIVYMLSNFFFFEIFNCDENFLYYDKKIDYENQIFMYVGRRNKQFGIVFILKPFEDVNYFIPFLGQKGVLIKHNDKIYNINLNTEMFKVLSEKIFNIQNSFNIVVDSFDELLNLIVKFKSLPFIQVVILEELLFKDVHKVKPENFRIKENIAGDYFEISGEIVVDNKKIIKFTDLLEASFEEKGDFVKLKNGEYIVVNENIIEQLKRLHTISKKEKGKIKFHKKLKFLLSSDKNSIISESKSEFKKIEDKIYKIPEGFKGVLRKYQIEGYNWLSKMYEIGFGACLADDMGLGKTVQAIAFMEGVINDKPFMVVSPVSLIFNWEREIKKFSKNLNPIIFHLNREIDLQGLSGNNVLLISYNLLVNENERLVKKYFNVIVFDEAQMIKNPMTLRSNIAKQLKSELKIALTGTPVENNLTELWNIMDLLNTGIMGTLEDFRKKFNNDIEKLKFLRKIIKPFILRRIKQDVLIELPEKTEIVIDYQMSDDEYSFYAALQLKAKEKFKNLLKESGEINRISILSEIVKLKLSCCHPKLVHENIEINTSTKESVLMNLIEEIIESNHKVLIFSQFVKFLNIVKKRFDNMDLKYFYMDGSTSIKKRREIISDFQENSNVKIFLLSLKTGGLGLNLTAADIVIHLDPWWNPAVELQASDRVHRIGQTKPVTIYKLISKNTIEEKILKLQDKKRKLFEFLLEDMDKVKFVSVEDLLELLK
jgi:SNF2 family DNA or RNA helicase